MHARTDTTSPSKGTVTERAGIVAFGQEALRSEGVGFGEVFVIEVD
jgi:hypothetical protein